MAARPTATRRAGRPRRSRWRTTTRLRNHKLLGQGMAWSGLRSSPPAVVPDGAVRIVGGDLAQDAVADRVRAALEDAPLLARQALPQHQGLADEVLLVGAQLYRNILE